MSTPGYQIIGIPTIRPALDGTEVMVGQTPSGGPNSTFQVVSGAFANVPRVVVQVTTSTAISSADSGKAISNNTATANLTWPLPPAVVGRIYEIRNDTDAYTLTIDPDGTDRIAYGGAGKYLRLLVRGSVVIECRTAGRWELARDVGVQEIEA